MCVCCLGNEHIPMVSKDKVVTCSFLSQYLQFTSQLTLEVLSSFPKVT